jgi:hypothetical protein
MKVSQRPPRHIRHLRRRRRLVSGHVRESGHVCVPARGDAEFFGAERRHRGVGGGDAGMGCVWGRMAHREGRCGQSVWWGRSCTCCMGVQGICYSGMMEGGPCRSGEGGMMGVANRVQGDLRNRRFLLTRMRGLG